MSLWIPSSTHQKIKRKTLWSSRSISDDGIYVFMFYCDKYEPWHVISNNVAFWHE